MTRLRVGSPVEVTRVATPLTEFQQFLSAMMVFQHFLDKSIARARADAAKAIQAIEASSVHLPPKPLSQAEHRETMRAKNLFYG